VIETFGTAAGRARRYANGSKRANMKELRFDADDRVWRAAFAFASEMRGHHSRGGGQVRRERKEVLQTADQNH